MIIFQDITDCNEDEELSEKKSKTAGGFTGRGVTLQMLLEDNILKPKEGAMSLEYMVGNVFCITIKLGLLNFFLYYLLGTKV